MTANYFEGLVMIKPQYTGPDQDNPENVTWWHGAGLTAALTNSQAVAIQAVFDPAWAAMWKEVGSAQASYVGSIIQDWQSDTGIEVSSVGTFTAVPGIGTNSIGANTAALISFGVAVRFKGGHGRAYLPNIAENAIANARQLNAANQENAQSGLQTLVDNMFAIGSTDGGGFLGQLFRYRNYPGSVHHPVPHPASITTITTNTVNLNLASQRRRLRKAAHN